MTSLFGKGIEAHGEKTARVLKAPVAVFAAHENGNQGNAVLFGARRQAVARLVGVAGLHAGRAVKIVARAGTQQVVGVIPGDTALTGQEAAGDLRLADDCGDGRLRIGVFRDAQHVGGGGIVVDIVDAVGVGEMRLRCAELGGGRVHFAAEHGDGVLGGQTAVVRNNPADIGRRSIGGVVARRQQHRLKQRLQIKAVADAQIGAAGLRIDETDLVAHRENGVLFGIFERDDCGEQLRHAGGVAFGVRLLAVQDGIVVDIVQHDILRGGVVIHKALRQRHGDRDGRGRLRIVRCRVCRRIDRLFRQKDRQKDDGQQQRHDGDADEHQQLTADTAPPMINGFSHVFSSFYFIVLSII